MNAVWVPLINLGLCLAMGFTVSKVRQFRGRETIYTRAEKDLVDRGFLTRKQVAEYHANIQWGGYSVLLISLVCLLVSIVTSGQAIMDDERRLILVFAATELGVAGTILVFSDLMHMNAISPALSMKERLRIVNRSIFGAGISILILLAGMQTFALLLDKNVTMILCGLELVTVIWFAWCRAIRETIQDEKAHEN